MFDCMSGCLRICFYASSHLFSLAQAICTLHFLLRAYTDSLLSRMTGLVFVCLAGSVTLVVGTLPGVKNGWNISVGASSEHSHSYVEQYFGVKATDNNSLWSENVLTPFIGRTLKIVQLDIIKRNAFNTFIELLFKTTSISYTLEPGCAPGVFGDGPCQGP